MSEPPSFPPLTALRMHAAGSDVCFDDRTGRRRPVLFVGGHESGADGAVARPGCGDGVGNAVGLGFLLPSEWCPLDGPGSFGMAGFGGSRAWANPGLELAFAYTPNLCSLEHFDAREATLSRAAVACVTRFRANHGLTGID